MKKLISGIVSIICLFSLLFYTCKSVDPEETIDPLDIQANLLNGTWKLKDASSAIKDGNVESTFSSLQLILYGSTKIGGNYSTTNSADINVWPNTGSWQFNNEDPNKLLRSDSVLISISLTDSTLTSSFVVSGGIKAGNWVFNFNK